MTEYVARFTCENGHEYSVETPYSPPNCPTCGSLKFTAASLSPKRQQPMSVYEILPAAENQRHYLAVAPDTETAKRCFGVPQAGAITSHGEVTKVVVSPLHRPDEWLVTVTFQDPS